MFRNKEELLAAFPLPQDLFMLADFAFTPPSHPGAVMLDNPPTFVNHASDAGGANTAFRFEGDAKRVVATREIAVGDELLQDYRASAHVGWLDTLLGGEDLVSARQLGERLEMRQASTT